FLNFREKAPLKATPTMFYIATGILEHGRRGFQRRLLAEIEEHVLTILQMNRHEPAAADVAAARMDNGLRVAHGHGRVDSVAALLENLQAGRGRQMLSTYHHRVPPEDRFGLGQRLASHVRGIVDRRERSCTNAVARTGHRTDCADRQGQRRPGPSATALPYAHRSPQNPGDGGLSRPSFRVTPSG